jgi:glycolate oxidase FAD binding subunit
MGEVRKEFPATRQEAAEVMRLAHEQELRMRPRGGGTKFSWGNPIAGYELEVETSKLDQVIEHNEGDLTAVVQAGVTLAQAQEAFGAAGQMLALDPPSISGRATIGGIIATGDSGPMRHRYGAARDILLGITMAFPGGLLASAGSKVIKNVAGYDLAKLMAGSFGTLGLVVEAIVRLHPQPPERVTARASSPDPEALGNGVARLNRMPLELESLDLCWERGEGSVLARCAGAAPTERAERALEALKDAGLEGDLVEHDLELWERQRALQRSDGVVLRVSGRASDLTRMLKAADGWGASVAARAGVGLAWLGLSRTDPREAVGAIEDLRRDLSPLPCVVLDGPPEVREKVDAWGHGEGPDVRLMRRVKARFDPRGICNPGIFVGGI